MKGLTEYEKFLLLRSLPTDWPRDNDGTPFLKRSSFDGTDWNSIEYASLSNISNTKNKNNKILLNFQYDKTLHKLWNNPLKFISKFNDFFAITTPDFSAYQNMDLWVIEENIRHGLWLGAWYQFFGLKVIPSVTWADERSFHICFDYIAEGSVVAISTVGVSKYKAEFLKGFNEMVKRIRPSLILVRGKPIEGMEGKFIFIDFQDTFERKSEYEQLHLFELDKIQIFGKEVN